MRKSSGLYRNNRLEYFDKKAVNDSAFYLLLSVDYAMLFGSEK